MCLPGLQVDFMGQAVCPAWLPSLASPAALALTAAMYLSSVGAKVFDTSEK